jgi:ABC-type phosphate/phosphonate transport system substrate-binding protein
MNLRFATYLAPILYDTYRAIADYIGAQLGIATTLVAGQSLHEFAKGQVDIGFTCGLPYALLADACAPNCPFELLAAPVLLGERYQNKPIYYSDIVVRSASPYASCTSIDDLQGCKWAYNQPESHSGWNLVCYSLLKCGKTPAHFGQLIQSGSHQRSLDRVLVGQADATAIDSHVLDVFLTHDKTAAASLRVIDSLGPSSIPPIVIATALAPALKRRIQAALLAMHEDPLAARALHEGAIARFARVSDEDYDDLREMYRVVKQSGSELRR